MQILKVKYKVLQIKTKCPNQHQSVKVEKQIPKMKYLMPY